MIHCTCPQGHQLKVKDSLAGRKGKCPKCGSAFKIPAVVEADVTEQVADESESFADFNDDPYGNSPLPQKRQRKKSEPTADSTTAEQPSAIDKPSGAKNLSLSDLKGWKAVAAAIVIVSLVALRVTNRMNRAKDGNAPAVAQLALPLSTEVRRGEDITIEETVVVPTPVGYTWKLKEHAKTDDGIPFTSYTASSSTGDSTIGLSFRGETISGASERTEFVGLYRTSLIESMTAAGILGLNGNPPVEESPGRFQFLLTGADSNQVAVHIRAAVIFGKNTYFYELVSDSIGKADQLLALAAEISELNVLNNANEAVVENSKQSTDPTSITIGAAPNTKSTAALAGSGTNRPVERPAPSPQPQEPARLPTGKYDVVELPGPVFDTTAARGGNVLLFHMSGSPELVVVDLKTRGISGRIPISDEALIAAGEDHLVVVSPSENRIERWSLDTFQMETSSQLDITGQPQAIAMGYSSHGPVLMHWSDPDKRYGSYGLIDLQSFEIRMVSAGDSTAAPGQISMKNSDKQGVQLRASADSKVFTLRPGNKSPNMERLFAGRKLVTTSQTTGAGGHVIPTPDARMICTGTGYYGAGFSSPGKQGSDSTFPTCDKSFFLTLNQDGVAIRDVISGQSLRTLAPLVELGKDYLSEARWGYKRQATQLVPDQRIHCVPALNILVTIPESANQLFIREIPFDQIPDRQSLVTNDVLPLPGVIYNAMWAGDGRLAVLHLAEKGDAVVVDLAKRKIIGSIPAVDDALVAAGRNKLIVVSPGDKRVSRWSLATMKLEQEASFDLEGIARALVMGEASDGPATLYWTNDRGGIFSQFDVETLKLKQLTKAPYDEDGPGEFHVHTTGREWGGVSIRAAADGESFGLWGTGSPTGVEIVTPGNSLPVQREHATHGYVIPTGANRVLTGKGTFSMDAGKLVFADDGNSSVFSTADPRYMVCINKTSGELKEIHTGEVVATFNTPSEMLEDLFRYGGFGQTYPYQLVLDQRVYCLPASNVLATIPLTDDRLMFHEVEF